MIEIIRGDTRILYAQVFTDTSQTQPYSLTGVQAIKWTLRETHNGKIRMQKTVSNGITVTNAAGGLLEVLLPAADTATLPPGRCVWDIEITDSGGSVHTPVIANMVVVPDVTY